MLDMWDVLDSYLYYNKESITVNDARLLYYFCDQVERFGYESSKIKCLLDRYMDFDHEAWKHIRKLEAKGAFNGNH